MWCVYVLHSHSGYGYIHLTSSHNLMMDWRLAGGLALVSHSSPQSFSRFSLYCSVCSLPFIFISFCSMKHLCRGEIKLFKLTNLPKISAVSSVAHGAFIMCSQILFKRRICTVDPCLITLCKPCVSQYLLWQRRLIKWCNIANKLQ